MGSRIQAIIIFFILSATSMIVTNLLGTLVLKQNSNAALIVSVISVLLAALMTGLFVVLMEKRIKFMLKVKEYLDSFSNGDFSQEIEESSNDPFVEKILEELTTVSSNINNLIYGIKTKYYDATKKREALINQVESLVTLLAELKKNGEKQSEIYEVVVSNFEGVTGGVQEIASAANIAASTSSKTLELTSSTVELASNGMENVQESLIKMGEIKENTDKTAESVSKLEKLANEIGGIVGSITKISEQTNLLALNAAIEAARAGEAGKGFAVVAQEIRGLADESRKAAGSINEIVNIIQEETKQAVEKMNKTSIVVTEGSEISTSVGESLSVILDSISKINNMMGDVAAGAQQQSSNTHEIASKMDKIAGLVNEDKSKRRENFEYIAKTNSTINIIKENVADTNRVYEEVDIKLKEITLKNKTQNTGIAERK